MAVRTDDGELIEETRVTSEDLEPIAERYAGELDEVAHVAHRGGDGDDTAPNASARASHGRRSSTSGYSPI